VIVVSLSGRGDKDVAQARALLGAGLVDEPQAEALLRSPR
jgi:hypothetical protein